MSSSTDELSQYAPRWAREGIAKQKQNPSLPPAPQLVMPPDDDPPMPSRAPFNGDVRAWRNSEVAPIEQDEFDLIVTDTPSYRRKGFDERLFKTAAVASFAVIAMELIAFALFPNTVRDLFETHGPSWSAASSTPTTTVAQQNYASVTTASDTYSQSVETAATEQTGGASNNSAVSPPVLTHIPTPTFQTAEPAPPAATTVPTTAATHTADRASPLPTASAPPASKPADDMYVVTSSEPAAKPAQGQQQQTDLSQAAQPHTVKLERYSLTQSGSQGPQIPAAQAPAAQTPTAQAPAAPAQKTVAAQTPTAAPAVQASAPQIATVQAPDAQPPAVQSLAPPKVKVERNFSADELDRMVSRGEVFLAQGDVSAARVVLVRAAEARDPRAALALGSTYDPTVLQRMGAVGIRPDPEKAHFWYERAAEFGSGEAGKRLTALAELAR